MPVVAGLIACIWLRKRYSLQLAQFAVGILSMWSITTV